MKGWRTDEIREEGEDDEVRMRETCVKQGKKETDAKMGGMERGRRMIKIKPAAKMQAFRVSVTDISVRRKWGLESKHQSRLGRDRRACLATKPY